MAVWVSGRGALLYGTMASRRGRRGESEFRNGQHPYWASKRAASTGMQIAQAGRLDKRALSCFTHRQILPALGSAKFCQNFPNQL
jgi:phage gpG-like protein